MKRIFENCFSDAMAMTDTKCTIKLSFSDADEKAMFLEEIIKYMEENTGYSLSAEYDK